MVEFRVLIIDYLPGTKELEEDFETMKNKAEDLKRGLLNDRDLVVFKDQIEIEVNYKKGYVVVTIDSISDKNIKKVHKICKKIHPYSIRTACYC